MNAVSAAIAAAATSFPAAIVAETAFVAVAAVTVYIGSGNGSPWDLDITWTNSKNWQKLRSWRRQRRLRRRRWGCGDCHFCRWRCQKRQLLGGGIKWQWYWQPSVAMVGAGKGGGNRKRGSGGGTQKSTSLGIVICTAHHSTDIESNSGLIVLSDKFELKTKEPHGNKKWKKNKRDWKREGCSKFKGNGIMY